MIYSMIKAIIFHISTTSRKGAHFDSDIDNNNNEKNSQTLDKY